MAPSRGALCLLRDSALASTHTWYCFLCLTDVRRVPQGIYSHFNNPNADAEPRK